MPINNISKDVRYINKDFVSFRNALINFTKIYFPDSFNDFNESSLGMLFMEMSAYVGDVLSYYMDANLKESFLNYAEERQNIIYLAQSLGYKYKTTVPATTSLDVYQIIPSTGIAGQDIDFRFAFKIEEGMVVQSQNFPSVKFRTVAPIDFSIRDTDGFLATVYEVGIDGNPSLYLIKKSVPVVSGNITTLDFAISNTEQYIKIKLPYQDVIEILDVYDENSNRWYEVDYLAQDTILFDTENTDRNNTELYTGTNSSAPQRILKMKRVSKRFATRRDKDGYLELQFGSGTSAYPDEVLIPTPQTVKYNNNFSNFTDLSNSYLNTRTYGTVPSAGTVLTVRFTRGGGVQSNVPQGDLTKIISVTFKNFIEEFSTPEEQNTLLSLQKELAVSNPDAATGGRDSETIEEIRQNAMSYYSSQDRCVTDSDFLIRTLSMPAKYGSVIKAYVEKDSNNFSINIYTLGYDYQNKLITLNDTVKQNLITYLDSYRELTTAVNIKDAFVINIGIDFEIVTLSKYNKNDVLLKCILELKDFFNVDKWQIGQPIILRDLYEVLDKVEGVRTVSKINIYNKYGSENGYSNNYYLINSATMDGIIFTSKDPSIFEIKFPNIDIQGVSK